MAREQRLPVMGDREEPRGAGCGSFVIVRVIDEALNEAWRVEDLRGNCVGWAETVEDARRQIRSYLMKN